MRLVHLCVSTFPLSGMDHAKHERCGRNLRMLLVYCPSAPACDGEDNCCGYVLLSGEVMIHTKHLIKVTMAWISIFYVVCFVAVALLPSLRQQFMLYALHTDVSPGQNIMTPATFVVGFIVWNIIAALVSGLFS